MEETDANSLIEECASFGIITNNISCLEIFSVLKKAAKADSSRADITHELSALEDAVKGS